MTCGDSSCFLCQKRAIETWGVSYILLPFDFVPFLARQNREEFLLLFVSGRSPHLSEPLFPHLYFKVLQAIRS